MTTAEFGSLRSDDDQWDIVSGVGFTALLVAGWRAAHALSKRPLVRDDYARHFITATGDPYLTGLLEHPGTSEDETTFPRLYGVQTRFFDDFFTNAGETGIAQAVIVAAGLDSRGYRLDWLLGTTVFEVDLPKVLAFKARVLNDLGAIPGARRVEVAADLRTNWTAELTKAGFDPRLPTAWSVEGLLPYLTGDAQEALFAQVHANSAPDSRLATGALGSRLDHDQLAELEQAHPGVKLCGDVDFAALTYDDPADPAQWLSERGWTVEPVRNTMDLQAGYGLTPPAVDVKIDRFMCSQYVTATR